MANTGKGDFPLNSSWFYTNAGRLGAQHDTSVRKLIRAGTDGVAYKSIWSDFFFDVAGSVASTNSNFLMFFGPQSQQ